MGELLNTSGHTKGWVKSINYEKWDKLGLLNNLNGDVKENIAKLYECCSPQLLTSGNTKD